MIVASIEKLDLINCKTNLSKSVLPFGHETPPEIPINPKSPQTDKVQYEISHYERRMT